MWKADTGQLVYTMTGHSDEIQVIQVNTSVVVQFYPWFNFDFSLFFYMTMISNKRKSKLNQG